MLAPPQLGMVPGFSFFLNLSWHSLSFFEATCSMTSFRILIDGQNGQVMWVAQAHDRLGNDLTTMDRQTVRKRLMDVLGTRLRWRRQTLPQRMVGRWVGYNA